MSVGYLFSSVLGHLPLLAVLIAGFILVAGRRAQLGARSVLFARLGLGALALSSVLQIASTMSLPLLYSSGDYSVSQYGILLSIFGLMTSVILAAGIGLIIVALVTRRPEPGMGGGGPGFAGGQPFGASDRPVGPPSGS